LSGFNFTDERGSVQDDVRITRSLIERATNAMLDEKKKIVEG
jgi:hypothetical protein